MVSNQTDSFEDIPKKRAYTSFKKSKEDKVRFFLSYGVDVKTLLNKIESLPSDKFLDIYYTFTKVYASLSICSSLGQLQNQ